MVGHLFLGNSGESPNLGFVKDACNKMFMYINNDVYVTLFEANIPKNIGKAQTRL